jgi:hypothetical protein
MLWMTGIDRKLTLDSPSYAALRRNPSGLPKEVSRESGSQSQMPRTGGQIETRATCRLDDPLRDDG